MGDVSFLTIDTTGKNISSRNGQFLGGKDENDRPRTTPLCWQRQSRFGETDALIDKVSGAPACNLTFSLTETYQNPEPDMPPFQKVGVNSSDGKPDRLTFILPSDEFATPKILSIIKDPQDDVTILKGREKTPGTWEIGTLAVLHDEGEITYQNAII
ncbi:MAG: hypothetical protein IPK79_06625 [Vampirovibrionales bacterium]|nr:hypothetical protein [Vampirovibrionales bacterium]